MSKPKKFPRTEPTKAKPSVAPAGTPTTASAPEVPSSQAPEASPVKVVGESLKTVTSTQLVGTVATEAPKPVTRTGGASWFVPQQKPSGFGTGGTK